MWNEWTLSLLCTMDEVGEMHKGSAVRAGVEDSALASTYDCSFEWPYGEFLCGMGTVSRASFLDTADRERRRWIGIGREPSGEPRGCQSDSSGPHTLVGGEISNVLLVNAAVTTSKLQSEGGGAVTAGGV